MDIVLTFPIMEGDKRYIPEDKAVELVKLEAHTLRSFADTGYLQTRIDDSGAVMYRADELEKLFGVNIDATQFNEDSGEDERRSEKNASNEASNENSYDQNCVREEKITDLDSSSKIRVLREFASQNSFETSENVAMKTNLREGSKDSATVEDLRQEIVELRREKELLTRSIDLLERLLQTKEQEVKRLGEEVAWLRQQIDRTNERLERDQIIMLAESDTVRRILWDKRRSPIRAVLEWFGFVQTREFPSAINIQPFNEKER